MAGNAKPNVDGLRNEATLSLNSSYVRFNNGVANVNNDISALFDENATTTSPYGALLLVKTSNNFIDFSCAEPIKIWCIGTKKYSDSGGAAPKDIVIEKWNGSGWNSLAERSTNNDGVWYDLTGQLAIGRYRITPKADYVSMDEWYVEIQRYDKFLLSSNGKYYSVLPVVNSTTNAVPIMTTNTTPSGIASASTEYSTSYQAWKAFNGTTVDTGDCWVTTNNVLTGWLQYKFDTPKMINRYAVISRNGANRGDLKAWTFEGSNDGERWLVLDTRNYESAWNANEKREYELKNKFGSYMYYRINITEVTLVSATYISIGELLLYETSIPSMIRVESKDEKDFIKYGMFDSNLTYPIKRIQNVLKSSVAMGSGKVFSHYPNIKKYSVSKITLGDGKLLVLSGSEYQSINQPDPNKNTVPIMTSNTTPSGVASASSFYTNASAPWRAFDETNSAWQGGQGLHTNQWLQYKFDKPMIIGAYVLFVPSNYAVGGMPRDWSFEGSNDGINWSILDTRNNISSWVAGVKRRFEFENRDKYQYYRIFIKAKAGGGNYIWTKMEMFENYKEHIILDKDKTEGLFIDYGMNAKGDINLKDPLVLKRYILTKTENLGTGKVFKQLINTATSVIENVKVT